MLHGAYIEGAMRPALTADDTFGDRKNPVSSRLRRLLEAGAALAGIAAGALFAEPVTAAGGALWHGYVLPAYDELIKNGVLAWCM